MKRPLLQTDFTFDDQARLMTVAGVRYSYELFAAFGMHGLRVGEKFQIVKREPDGALTVARFEADEA